MLAPPECIRCKCSSLRSRVALRRVEALTREHIFIRMFTTRPKPRLLHCAD
eukprot:IDg20454t1